MRNVMELGPRGTAISTPTDAYAVLKAYAGGRQERFIVVTIDGAHRVLQCHVISTGTANKAFAHPRDVFWAAVLDNAVAIIVAHTHPSGNLQPSIEDVTFTANIKKCGEIMEIRVLDHLIIGPEGLFYSFLHGHVVDENGKEVRDD